MNKDNAHLCAGVYRIEIGRFFYVGGTVDFVRRERSHLNRLRSKTHENERMQNAYNKYQKFTFKVVEVVSNEANFISEVVRMENSLLKQWFGHELCMNLSPTAFSQYGFQHSEASKLKMRRCRSEEGKRNIRRGLLMRSWRPSNEMRLSSSKRMLGEKNPNFGKKITSSQREKLSQAHRGKRLSLETRKLISENLKRSKSRHKKPVTLLSFDGEILDFESNAEAALFLGVSRTRFAMWKSGSNKIPTQFNISHII